MDAQMKRGLVDACVLKALMHGDSYGYKIVRDTEEVMELSESTLYPVLRRLESSGALSVYSMEHNGRLRKYYSITEEGRRRIDGFLRDWEDVMRVYEFVRRDVKS